MLVKDLGPGEADSAEPCWKQSLGSRMHPCYPTQFHTGSPFPGKHAAAAAAAKSLQSCPPLCDPTDGIPPGSPVPGILQARTLEWVAISFSSA